MSKRPVVGIIGRAELTDEGDPVICIYEKCRRSLMELGALPLLILPPQNLDYAKVEPKDTPSLTEEEENLVKEYVDQCDALFIPGGYMWRSYDFFICKYALEKDMPILGVCMGMQMLGRIHNDSSIPSTVKNETSLNHKQKGVDYVHSVTIAPDSLLYQIVGKEKLSVNSLHNYHVPSIQNLKVSATSEDGLIEAVEDPKKRFVLGVQWHPEGMVFYDEDARKILLYFIEHAKKYHNEKNCYNGKHVLKYRK